MEIKARDVTVKVVDHIDLTAEQWDSRPHGSWGWRLHMAKVLNLRVKKLAPQCNAVDFYMQLNRFATEIGFGEQSVIVAVTEKLYNVNLVFDHTT